MQQTSAVVKTGSRSVEINKVLKNTYLLLSATLLFSAGTAGLAMYFNVGMINPFVYLAVIFGMSFLMNKTANSASGIFVVFAFTGFLGFYAGPIVNFYTQTAGASVVLNALGGTGLIFFTLSGYVLTTRKDFSFLRGFLFAGLMVLFLAVIASLVASMFGFHMPAVSLAISALFVMLMSGFILYDTSSIMRGEQTNYLLATVNMYVNIWVLFMHLMHLLAFFSGED